MKTAHVLCALAILGCGGASSPPVEHPAPTTTEASQGAWSIAPCATLEHEEVGTEDDGTRLFLAGRDRLAIDPNGVLRRATQIPEETLAVAHAFDGDWYFATDTGVILHAAGGFLGDLTVVANVPMTTNSELPSRGVMLFGPGGGPFWIFEPEGGARVLPLPERRTVLELIVRWPSTIAALVEPGELLFSRDRGATWARAEVEHAVVDLGIDDESIWARLSNDSGLRLDDEGNASEDATVGERESEEEEYAEEQEAEGEAEENDGLPSEPEAWCSPIPLAIASQWGTSEMPLSNEEFDLPARCNVAVGRSTVIALCSSRRRTRHGAVELRVLDPRSGEFHVIGPVPGMTEISAQPADSDGSRTFAFDDYGDEGPHTWFFDGTALVDVGNDARLRSVHDDMAWVGEEQGITLVRLPSREVIALELPAEVGTLHWADFAADGTLLAAATAAGADETGEQVVGLFLVGTPGHWTTHPLPADALRLAMADARRGVLASRSELRHTTDGGATWISDGIASSYGAELSCTRDGCALGGLATFRAQSGLTPTVIATRATAQSEPAEMWHRDRVAIGWRCERPHGAPPPSESPTQWSAQGDWGWAQRTDTETQSVTWTGGDVRGAYHGHASVPPNEDGGRWWGPALATRTFALMTGDRGFAIASASPHVLDTGSLDVTLAEGSSPTGVALADGSALVSFEVQTAYGDQHRSRLVAAIDRNGRITASRVLVLADDYMEHRAFAFGPGGVTGMAVSDADANHWTVYRLDGGESVVLDAPLTSGVPCAHDQPWTFVLQDSLAALAIGDEWSTSDTTTTLGVDQGSACVASIRSHYGYDGAIPIAFTTRGAVHGLALDSSAHGTTLTCAYAPPETE